MARQTGLTTNTVKNYVIGPGAVYQDYGLPGQALIGATAGGNTFTVETEYRQIEIDGLPGPGKELRRITNVDVSLTVNLFELTAANVSIMLTGSTITDQTTYDEIKRSLEIAAADYLGNVAVVGQVSGSANPIVCICKNAIVDSNFELGLTDDEEAVVTVTFKGHFDVSTPTDEPWEVQWPKIV